MPLPLLQQQHLRRGKEKKVSTVLASPLERLTPKKGGGYIHGAERVLKTDAVVINEVADFIDDLASRSCCVSVHQVLTTCNCLSALKGNRSIQQSIAKAILQRYVKPSATDKKLCVLSRKCNARLSATTQEAFWTRPLFPSTCEPIHLCRRSCC